MAASIGAESFVCWARDEMVRQAGHWPAHFVVARAASVPRYTNGASLLLRSGTGSCPMLAASRHPDRAGARQLRRPSLARDRLER
jgi:hypothetical protein